MDDVTTSGPLFDGRAEAELHRGIEEIRHRVAERGQNRVQSVFAGQIRENHGRFLSSITVIDATRAFSTRSGRHVYTMVVSADRAAEQVVTTDLASYGPWLEGSGSRNETTRFKGYHGFRMAGQELDGEAGRIAEETIKPYVAEMNA